MRVVAVTPNWRWDETPLSTDTLQPPLSSPLEWAYLSAGLPDGLTAVVDAYAADATVEETVERVAALTPDHVIVSSAANLLYWRCPPFTVEAVARLVHGFRAAGQGFSVGLVGPHGTHSPTWALRQTGVDWVWRGSADVRLAPALLSGEPHLSPHACTGTRTGAIAVDMAEQLPVADHRALGEVRYPPHAWSVGIGEAELLARSPSGALVEASRGCPWACVYCAKAPVRDRHGRRPVDRVARELTSLKQMGVSYVFFIDETFNIPSPHLQEVLHLLQQLDLSFGFQGRPDLINRERAASLAASGCTYVELGIDVVGDGLSTEVGRRQSLERAEQGLEACKEVIPVVRFNRLNFETLDYLELFPHEGGPAWDVPVDPIYPYPGSALGATLMQHYGRRDFDWDFGRRYSWWLRVEVGLQRTQPHLAPAVVRELMASFLAMSEPAATAVAASARDLVAPPNLHEMNKSVEGHGGRLHVRHPGLE